MGAARVAGNTSTAELGNADCGGRSSGEGDSDRGSEVELEEIKQFNIELNGNTNVEGEGLRDGDGAVSGLDEDSGVVEEADPDGNVGTGTNVEAENVKVSIELKTGTETETKAELNLSRQVHLGTNSNGQRLGSQTLKMGVDNLLGKQVDLNVGVSRDDDVETSKDLDGGIDANHEIEGESSAEVDLKEAWDLNGKLLRGEQLNRLEDTGSGTESQLDVSLDISQADADSGSN